MNSERKEERVSELFSSKPEKWNGEWKKHCGTEEKKAPPLNKYLYTDGGRICVCVCVVVGCNKRDCICKSIFIAENCNNVIKCGKYIYTNALML